jgi:hypothetical protein
VSTTSTLTSEISSHVVSLLAEQAVSTLASAAQMEHLLQGARPLNENVLPATHAATLHTVSAVAEHAWVAS